MLGARVTDTSVEVWKSVEILFDTRDAITAEVRKVRMKDAIAAMVRKVRTKDSITAGVGRFARRTPRVHRI